MSELVCVVVESTSTLVDVTFVVNVKKTTAPLASAILALSVRTGDDDDDDDVVEDDDDDGAGSTVVWYSNP